MKRCVFYFALFILAVVAAAIIDNSRNEGLVEEVEQNEETMDNLVVRKDF